MNLHERAAFYEQQAHGFETVARQIADGTILWSPWQEKTSPFSDTPYEIRFGKVKFGYVREGRYRNASQSGGNDQMAPDGMFHSISLVHKSNQAEAQAAFNVQNLS